jgi:hypothetical protein
MARRDSEPPIPVPSQCYDPVAAGPEFSIGEEDKEIMSVAAENPITSAQIWSVRQVLLTAIVPVIALFVWLFLIRENSGSFDTFAGEIIGGRFTQAQAKAIDVVTGAILVPLLMAALNYVWFTSARVSVVNEQHHKPIPLRTLVTVSGTSAGTYDLFHFRDLLQGKTRRLFLFGVLVLLSAVSRSALSNVIAYEAYDEEVNIQVKRLRLLKDHAVDTNVSGAA